ncbi:MAG TPA: hypothetical protein VG757_05650 [Devosia sp.]|nr:hypothetical protein [Devosia sp.]
MKFIAACLACLVLAIPLPAAAQSSLASYDAVRTALLAIWDELPLTVRNASFTAGPATGYGAYPVRDGSSFAAGETVNVYAELLGYGFAEKDGLQAASIDADLFLVSADGRTLARQDRFLTLSFAGTEKRLETYLSFQTSLTGFPPGDYSLEVRLTDNVGGKTAEFSLPLTLTPAP